MGERVRRDQASRCGSWLFFLLSLVLGRGSALFYIRMARGLANGSRAGGGAGSDVIVVEITGEEDLDEQPGKTYHLSCSQPLFLMERGSLLLDGRQSRPIRLKGKAAAGGFGASVALTGDGKVLALEAPGNN